MFLETKKDGEDHVADARGMVPKPDLGGLRVYRILALAEEIERPTRGLMLDLANWCGSICCIAGHAAVMFGVNSYGKDDNHPWGRFVGPAGEALGLGRLQADTLFTSWANARDRSPRGVASVLRHLAQTGEVNWQV